MTVLQEIKAIHPEYIALIKVGNFYNVYLKDAYILSYLFDYKIREYSDNIKTCGFPVVSLKKVIARLENKKINYLIIDRRNNYELDEKFDMGNLNKYSEIYNKAKKQINLKTRIDKVSQYMHENINKESTLEILKKIEQEINNVTRNK